MGIVVQDMGTRGIIYSMCYSNFRNLNVVIPFDGGTLYFRK